MPSSSAIHEDKYLIKSEIVLELINGGSDIRFFTRGKYKLKDMFQSPLEDVEMLVSVPIVVTPNSVGVMLMAFKKRFVCTEEQILHERNGGNETAAKKEQGQQPQTGGRCSRYS